MEGLGCQGRAAEGPGGEAGLEEEELLELRSRGQSIDSACDSHLPSHPLPPYSTSAPLPGGALAPEEGRNTAPRRGKRGGVGLLGPGGRVPHGRGSEDRSEEVLPEPGGRVPHRKWSEDSGLDVPQRSEEVLLEPGGREIHRLRCEDSGPGDHDDTWSERIDLESGQGRTSVQLRNKEWTGPETREEKQKWASAPETEQQSPLLTSGPEASRGASPGTRRCMRTLLPPTGKKV
ncbi:hypothetical protein NDU88_005083 [Pleurodeles waltl]|uniref:Uncharacterized protein n=1 Tax=Pleurodeles waltl TaxID=8319 RepID=A0AAV7V2Y8_PLEWA|nr:hypothetical protein NDU88_005083 [Pleurodeles waltl]